MELKKLYQGQLTDTLSTIFTATQTTNILGIKLHNTSLLSIVVNLHSVVSGGIADTTNKFESILLEPGQSLYISVIGVLSAGDFISAEAEITNKVNCRIIGELQNV